MVSTSAVYSTCGNPQNSLWALFSTTRLVSPEITVSDSPSLTTTAVRTSGEDLRNEKPTGVPSTSL